MPTVMRTLVAAAILAAPSGAVAQYATTLPSARDIVTRYVEALGGEAAITRQRGRTAHGTLSVPAQGISGPFALYAAAPNRAVLRVTIAGLGEISGGYNGTVGWSVNPAVGPMVLDGRMLEQAMQEADFHGALHRAHIASMETVEETEFEGSAAYKVKITTEWGEEFFEFFDKQSGLLVGSIRQQASPMGEFETTTIYSDYRPVGGVLLPFGATQRTMGIDQVFTADSIKVGAVPDSMFALPAQIRALVEGG